MEKSTKEFLDTEGLEHLMRKIKQLTDTFVWEQTEASDTWEITQNKEKYPSVTVVNSAGTVVTGSIEYIDKNTVRLKFANSFSGTAYLN